MERLIPIDFGNVIDIKNIIMISCGDGTTMIMTKDRLYACGKNEYGQLGIGNNKNQNVFTRVKTEGIGNLLSVTCGQYFTIILTSKGLYGCGETRIFGIKSENKYYDTPQKIDYKLKISNILAITAHEENGLILSKGGLYGFGENNYKVPGFEGKYSTLTTLPISDVLTIGVGGHHVIVVALDGIYGFGSNREGQLGVGDHIKVYDRFTKININIPGFIKMLVCGDYYTVLVVNVNGKDVLYGFGWNEHGELNNKSKVENIYLPEKIDIPYEYDEILEINSTNWYTIVRFLKNNKKYYYSFGNRYFKQLDKTSL